MYMDIIYHIIPKPQNVFDPQNLGSKLSSSE